MLSHVHLLQLETDQACSFLFCMLDNMIHKLSIKPGLVPKTCHVQRAPLCATGTDDEACYQQNVMATDQLYLDQLLILLHQTKGSQ